ncbi:bifunctional aldolase/short-chain dehydrogenase [Lacihabitans soyangensis]|uniref:Bifunctional aldolase/short-chain dehydrogenase n=1 Tax=Lacihabitans soyangensis TaxID=869394 RepID=A0AAE3KV24_9BACT|nr:bifunctional aldolase/short-chain dehydrogenase [Lacihabitans soyangensis]MCP9766252.1 bifunctional aldolase/short-chain dehydrogenase [Lacihabitans soyangensis]
MSFNKDSFKHANYLWDEAKAAEMAGDEVALFIYRSNLLGADLRLTNYGGGNTSVKISDKDPLTGKETQVMWIKGSGGDIGTLKKSGCAALYMERLLNLENVYRGIEHEDEMVELFNHCIFDLASKAPSIDTPLHGFLPFKHIDHLHPDAAIAIAAAKDGKKITEELFNGEIGWVGWQRPGFDLGLKLRACLNEAAAKGITLKGIMLGSHGLFTWGDTAYSSYINTLEVIEKCAQYLEDNFGKTRPVFGGQKIESLADADRKAKAAALAPTLRGYCSSERKMVGHFTDDSRVLEFINSNDLAKLAPLGTSCPDHFLRTKIAPLVLDPAKIENKEYLTSVFEEYRTGYKAYYYACKHPNSPAMRDPNPVVILYPGVGMFTFAKDKTMARLASEYYTNAINVMKGAEAVSEYTALPHQEAFDIEYWLLEEAKLQRMPKPKALSGRIALITGSAGGIGKAIARKFAEEGACVILNDINQERLDSATEEFLKLFGRDAVASTLLNVTDKDSAFAAFENTALAFGGVDIVVNNAGISISKSIAEHSLEEWDRLYDILVKGQFIVSQAGVAIMRKQGIGGDIVNIVSKNAVVAGPNNPGYGSAKAAQAHMTRLMAAELGADKIRVNTVNPDAVISDSNIWAGGWAEGRAKAYGITVEELPAYYAKRTLLNEIILPDDIANACFAFVGGLLNKSTGNAINVDGGVAMGFYR